MEYTINYHTGAGNETFEGDLEEAQARADGGCTYTQQPISIEDADGNEITRRSWWGTLDGWEDADSAIRFGSYGYYDDWS